MKKHMSIGDERVVGNPIIHFIRCCVYMYVFWLLIVGQYSIKFMLIGAVSAIIVSYVCMPIYMIFNEEHTKKYFMLDINLFKLVVYFFWLIKEIVLANIDVIRTIISKNLDILSPSEVVCFSVSFDNPVALVMLAMSITLTPGTITINVSKNKIYEIHCLTEKSKNGILCGTMPKMIAWLFNEKDGFSVLDMEADRRTF